MITRNSRHFQTLMQLKWGVPIELLDIDARALSNMSGVQYNKKIYPYKSAILWRQFFDLHEIRARILSIISMGVPHVLALFLGSYNFCGPSYFLLMFNVYVPNGCLLFSSYIKERNLEQRQTISIVRCS